MKSIRTLAHRLLFLLFGYFVLSGTASRAEETAYSPTAGDWKVVTWLGEWRDASRARTIPVKIYYPEAAAGKNLPLIVFSHGLGASRETYAYLGQYWAAHGYISVHVQHPGSDAEVMASTKRPLLKLRKLKEAAADPANRVNRPRDIAFAIDELTRLSTDPAFPLQARMALDRLAAAGHSFGAYTVMAIAGQAVGPDRSVRYYGPDPRIKAAVAMSGGIAQMANLDEAYDRITIPIFHLTGTRDQLGNAAHGDDDAVIGDATAAQRRIAYDHTRHAPAFLLTFKDGDHRVFANARGRMAGGEHDDAYQKIVCVASTAFWDATLKRDPAARRWFEQGGLAARLGDSGTLEQKSP